MINTEIISVKEYVDIMIECKRNELSTIVTEGANTDMINMYNHHIKMIRAYIQSAAWKKQSGLFRECKSELKKAESEIDAMEKSIRDIDPTTLETVCTLFPKIAVSALGYVFTLIFYKIHKTDWYRSEETGVYYKNRYKGEAKNASIISAVIASATTAINALKVVKNYRKEINKGSNKKAALNQFRAYIINACEKTRKYIADEIKYVDTVLASDERYSKE